MITIYDTKNNKFEQEETFVIVELRGLSTDIKPTEINGKTINNGSTFIEIDTGNIYFYDLANEEWKEV